METKKRSVIIHANSIKEAKQIARDNYGADAEYIRPYRYASKGNNFYEFLCSEEKEVVNG